MDLRFPIRDAAVWQVARMQWVSCAGPAAPCGGGRLTVHGLVAAPPTRRSRVDLPVAVLH
ncbi:hypothetical protein XalbCFBP2523_05420 [Xanthomonas albilineans]|nr:hypothetical protein XalbCFBP2523_05420 [Xanthomonas albilineans]